MLHDSYMILSNTGQIKYVLLPKPILQVRLCYLYVTYTHSKKFYDSYPACYSRHPSIRNHCVIKFSG